MSKSFDAFIVVHYRWPTDIPLVIPRFPDVQGHYLIVFWFELLIHRTFFMYKSMLELKNPFFSFGTIIFIYLRMLYNVCIFP